MVLEKNSNIFFPGQVLKVKNLIFVQPYDIPDEYAKLVAAASI